MKSSLFISFFFLAQIVFADALFPLSSGRPQKDGNCWAYGAAHMLEAKAQVRDGISAMANIEKSYRYWLLYDRLLNSYHRKMTDEGDGGGDGINDIGAFAADLLEIYEAHGFEMIQVQKAATTSDLQYPNDSDYRNVFQYNQNSKGLQKPRAYFANRTRTN